MASLIYLNIYSACMITLLWASQLNSFPLSSTLRRVASYIFHLNTKLVGLSSIDLSGYKKLARALRLLAEKEGALYRLALDIHLGGVFSLRDEASARKCRCQ